MIFSDKCLDYHELFYCLAALGKCDAESTERKMVNNNGQWLLFIAWVKTQYKVLNEIRSDLCCSIEGWSFQELTGLVGYL
ncbi:hypothetical protein GV64_07585 [Endozoicomonas elysicola]|uniref:Uncharacterized protein n=1 Tax=Endozoicomonas elysicola TaxID=305900 RepID=A0A081K8Z4_9GAMM|nr:hypothetical protein GV64_07585 [Endozoicomonas elysicola]